jgi:hypothetical protein
VDLYSCSQEYVHKPAVFVFQPVRQVSDSYCSVYAAGEIL